MSDMKDTWKWVADQTYPPPDVFSFNMLRLVY